MAVPYETWLPTQVAPAYLGQPRGLAWTETHGAALDALVLRVRDAIKARFLALAPTDALPYLGADSALERYPNFTDDDYRAWLLQRWALWKLAGTPAGLLAAFAAAGFVGTTLETAHEVDAMDTDWSKFWVDLYPPFPAWTGFPGIGGAPAEWVVRLWGQTSPITGNPYYFGELSPDGSAFTWGSTASSRQVGIVKRIVEAWRPAHVRCEAIRVHLASGTVLSWRSDR